jgi:hypothetical protein
MKLARVPALQPLQVDPNQRERSAYRTTSAVVQSTQATLVETLPLEQGLALCRRAYRLWQGDRRCAQFE